MTHRGHRSRGAIFRRRRQRSTPTHTISGRTTRFRTIERIRKIRVPRRERHRRRRIISTSSITNNGSITSSSGRTRSRRRETHGRSDGGGGGSGGGGEGGRGRHGIGHGRGGRTSASYCRRYNSPGAGGGVTDARGVATRRGGNRSPPGRTHGRRRARPPPTWMHVQPRERSRRRGGGGRAVMCRRLPRGWRRRGRGDGTGGRGYTMVSAAGTSARAENEDERGDDERRDPCASRVAHPRGHGCKAGQDGCEANLTGEQHCYSHVANS